jgi:hypothetical protein
MGHPDDVTRLRGGKRGADLGELLRHTVLGGQEAAGGDSDGESAQ